MFWYFAVIVFLSSTFAFQSELAQLRELESTEAGEIDENENEFDITPPRRSRSGPAMEVSA